MSGFTKLVPEIVQSSIWNESAEIRIVWITLLAIKDEEGNVRGNIKTLARLANVRDKSVQEALRKFQEPDPDSNTPEKEGRRIEAIPGGWHVINHSIYRAKDYKDYEAERKREYRKRVSGTCPGQVPDSSASASVSVSSSVLGKEESQERGKPTVEPESKWSLDDCLKAAAPIGMRREDVESFFHHYASVGWIDAAGRKIRSLPSALAKWKANQPSHGRRGELPDAPPTSKPKPKRDDLLADVVRDLWEKRDDDQRFKRALSTWRDKLRDMPGIVDEAMEIVQFRRERGEK